MAKMIHLVMGWTTPVRQGDPRVLYCGEDAAKAIVAVNNPPAGIQRVERALVHDSFKQRPFKRSSELAPAPSTVAPPQAAESEEATIPQVSSPEEQPPGDGQIGDGLPELPPEDTGTSKKKKNS